jgi:hypothetical protein
MRPQPAPQVIEWLVRHDGELAIPSIVLAEVAFGIHRLQPDRRAKRLLGGLDAWRRRMAGSFSSEDLGSRRFGGWPSVEVVARRWSCGAVTQAATQP